LFHSHYALGASVELQMLACRHEIQCIKLRTDYNSSADSFHGLIGDR
jgi:hypothetical protein